MLNNHVELRPNHHPGVFNWDFDEQVVFMCGKLIKGFFASVFSMHPHETRLIYKKDAQTTNQIRNHSIS